MILTRTPFRLPLGGGSTDLPGYYEKHGGFIFSVTINLYMYIGLNRPPADDLIRLKYRDSEEVEKIADLKHNIARAALQRTGVAKMVEISSMADVSDGTGLGSSASYLVGLLNALHILKGENISRRQLAEEAFEIATEDLGLPDGKQDFYLAAFGNFCILDIAQDGSVMVSPAKVSRGTQQEFEKRTLLFYTGLRRSSVDILQEQQVKLKASDFDALTLKHEIKRIGQEILRSMEANDLDKFGRLMDEHWQVKRRMSQKMSNDSFDELYDKVKSVGVLGGKIVGAGGGGFFLVYCQDGSQTAVRKIFADYSMREIDYRVDAGGTQVILHRPRSLNTI
ncbi:MAG: hypothetical protein A2754_03615 [Candidatus Magasanikbacteria bacterium RIFCSPHIGHO2_01_FULL_47_8]|uniref:Galactokinase n=1 Tax=Candidatus Magasanikbacteria bacterium RIFCSPHIGHO2_01_FULL_47_8 TaxID=1798673 RepID=A0A1F6MDM1_9BACT|nr:MAG: hypothetical protein A2754_03615 [Candidatus Magasanikbacteria bacterium RIFCSPHIGHO2_01_FULL_47_8]